MGKLKIIEALYFDPNDKSRNFDAKNVLEQMVDFNNDRLFYDGRYNDIFDDPAKRVNKKLKIILEFNGHKYTNVYEENEKIDIPADLPREPIYNKGELDLLQDNPSEREMRVMDFLYREYQRSGENKAIKAIEIFQILNIPEGQDVSTLNDSHYLNKVLAGTHEAFKLSMDGIRYMDRFYKLVRREYDKLAGFVKDSEMVNKDKASRARQWARERMNNATEVKDIQSIHNETILGNKFVQLGSHNIQKNIKNGAKGSFWKTYLWPIVLLTIGTIFSIIAYKLGYLH